MFWYFTEINYDRRLELNAEQKGKREKKKISSNVRHLKNVLDPISPLRWAQHNSFLCCLSWLNLFNHLT